VPGSSLSIRLPTPGCCDSTWFSAERFVERLSASGSEAGQQLLAGGPGDRRPAHRLPGRHRLARQRGGRGDEPFDLNAGRSGQQFVGQGVGHGGGAAGHFEFGQDVLDIVTPGAMADPSCWPARSALAMSISAGSATTTAGNCRGSATRAIPFGRAAAKP
jgi:hypothetical protein